MSGSVKRYGPTWRIRWDVGVGADGKRVQRSRAGYATRKDAEKALKERLAEVERGQLLDVSKLTVADYLTGWLESKRNIRSSTRRSYEGHIRVHVIPHIGQVPLPSLRADHLDAMYAAIRNGSSGKAPGIATVRRVHATLRTALNAAYRRRLIPYNPAGQVELDPEPVRERDVWTPSQLSQFLDVASQDRLGAAYQVLAMTGMRRGECCGLHWSDVDLEAGTLTIRQQLTQSGKDREFGEPKTRRGARRISLDAATAAALRAHKAAQAAERLSWGPAYSGQDLVFCKEDGSPVAPDLVSRRFITLSRQAELPRIVLHGLRHTYATHALAAGVDVTIVSKRLGHARSSFTADTYTRLPEQVDRDAAELIAAMVRQAGRQGAAGDAP